MRSHIPVLLLLGTLVLPVFTMAANAPDGDLDPRLLSAGLPIPGGRYCDQPYVVQTGDGAWLCAMTTADGAEGSATQRVITHRSTDQGKTWTAPISVEPPGPEASYAVLLATPRGRVYCFYNHNTDNVREVRREDGGVYTRVDSLGHYVFRFSDDGGQSWSSRRYEVPVREFRCDRDNVYQGRIRFFWNVGRPLVWKGTAFLTLHKVGAMGAGFFAQSEGVLLRSDNLLTEGDPTRIQWTTLPEGDIGLRTPPGGGRIAEEQCVTALSDGTLFCVYRSVDGHPVAAYSGDGGRSWTQPEYHRFEPGGRPFKHPRAANFVWRCGNGRFLYWFHNHGGAPARALGAAWDPYADRNPVWLCAGEERKTPQGRRIYWTEPEIVLYDDDSLVRISYPDLIEQGGRFWLTETQKSQGRVHAVPPALVEGLFAQFANSDLVRDWILDRQNPTSGAQEPAPKLPSFVIRDTARADHGSRSTRAGFTLELRLKTRELPGRDQALFDTRGSNGAGILLTAEPDGCLRLELSDGSTLNTWRSDAGTLRAGHTSAVHVIVDGGPRVILYVVDLRVQDGGASRQFGWGRFSPALRNASGTGPLRIGSEGPVTVAGLRVFPRALRVSEAIGNQRAAAVARSTDKCSGVVQEISR